MTPTEQDLRTLLREPVDAASVARVADQVADRVSGRVAGRVRGRTGASSPAARPPWWRIGVVTALAVVVVVGVVLAVAGVRPGRDGTAPVPPARTSASPLPSVSRAPAPAVSRLSPLGTVAVQVAPGSGYRIGAVQVFDAEQFVDVDPDASRTALATAHVVADGAGVAPTPDPGRAPVDLGGGVTASWETFDPAAGDPSGGPSLTWSAAGLRVDLQPTADSRGDDGLLAIARSLTLGTPTVLRVPVSVSAWPAAGWRVQGLISTYVTRDGADGTAGRSVAVDVEVPGSRDTSASIQTLGLSFAAEPTGTPVQIAGRTWFRDATSTSLTWKGADRYVVVTAATGPSGGAGPVDADALTALVAALTLASDFADESTWSDAPGAFPS